MQHALEQFAPHFLALFALAQHALEQFRAFANLVIEQDIVKYGTDEFELLSASEQEQVKEALATMTSKHRYCEHCARDVTAYVLRCRLAPKAPEDPEKAGQLEAAEKS